MFKIYYDTGEIYDGFENPGIKSKHIDDFANTDPGGMGDLFPSTMPPLSGVIAIAQYSPSEDKVDLLSGRDYYLWNDNHWIGADLWHVLDFFESRDFLVYKKNGVYVKIKNKEHKMSGDAELFAFLADTGLVLLGTSEKDEYLEDALLQIQGDFSDVPPERFRVPSGTKLRSRIRKRHQR